MIRGARKEDCEEVFGIYMHSMVNPFMASPSMPLQDFRKFKWHNNWKRTLVYEENGKILGFLSYAGYSGRKNPVVELVVLAVHPSQWGKGTARQLVERLFEMFSGKKSKAELSVTEDNARAIAFYQKMGFECEGERKNNFLRDGKLLGEKLMARYL